MYSDYTPTTPGWIYVANVLTWNGYEGVKIGGTERAVQERINEHLSSGDFKSFELIETYPVGDVWVCESHIKKTLSGDPAEIAPSFTEVWSKSIRPELIAPVYAYLYSGQTEKSDKALKVYQDFAKQNEALEAQGIFQPIWPNRSGGRVAAPVQATTNWAGTDEALIAGFKIIGAAAAIIVCLAYIKVFLVGLFFLLCFICQPKRGRPRKIW